MQPNDTKEQLEKQALQFFASNDYERSSLNDIAEALGVTKGAIYHYFKNKDDLFYASVNRLLNMVEGWFMDALPLDIPLKILLDNLFRMDETLTEIGEHSGLGDAITDYKNIMYLFLAALKKFPDIRKRLDDIYTGFHDVLADAMSRAVDKGEIRKDTDIEAVAYEITAFSEGALLLGAFTDRKDYSVLGPRVCEAIWARIALPAMGRRQGEKNETK